MPDPLALTAAELVGVAAGVVRLEADQGHAVVDRSPDAAPAARPCTRRPSPMLSPTVARGSSEA